MTQIITDSMSDILPQEAQRLGVRVAPLQVRFGETSYDDGIDIEPAAFYQMLREAQELPKTNQVAPAVFESLFAPSAIDGRKRAVHHRFLAPERHLSVRHAGAPERRRRSRFRGGQPQRVPGRGAFGIRGRAPQRAGRGCAVPGGDARVAGGPAGARGPGRAAEIPGHGRTAARRSRACGRGALPAPVAAHGGRQARGPGRLPGCAQIHGMVCPVSCAKCRRIRNIRSSLPPPTNARRWRHSATICGRKSCCRMTRGRWTSAASSARTRARDAWRWPGFPGNRGSGRWRFQRRWNRAPMFPCARSRPVGASDSFLCY